MLIAHLNTLLKSRGYIYGAFLLVLAILSIAAVIAIWPYREIFAIIYLGTGVGTIATKGIIVPIMRERRLRFDTLVQPSCSIEEPAIEEPMLIQEQPLLLQGSKDEQVIQLLNRGVTYHPLIVETIWDVTLEDRSAWKAAYAEFRDIMDRIVTPK